MQNKSLTHKKPLTIGTLAKQAKVNIETIRYYQKRGLIQEPEKPTQGYRIYPKEVLSQLLFIQRAKQVGFTLTEIKELLLLDEGVNCSEAQQMAQKKLEIVNNKLCELADIKTTLKRFIGGCKKNESADNCKMIQSLKNKL